MVSLAEKQTDSLVLWIIVERCPSPKGVVLQSRLHQAPGVHLAGSGQDLSPTCNTRDLIFFLLKNHLYILLNFRGWKVHIVVSFDCGSWCPSDFVSTLVYEKANLELLDDLLFTLTCST